MTNEERHFDEEKDTMQNRNGDRAKVRALPLELLITRLADGDGSDDEWIEFQRRAAESREPWQQLAEEQYISRKLREGFERATRRAMLVELADREAAAPRMHHQDGDPDSGGSRTHAPTPARSLAMLVRQYGGWAAAAVVVLAWILTISLDTNARHGIGQVATNQPDSPQEVLQRHTPDSVPVGLSPEGYLQKYIEEAPHVLREMPPLLLQARISNDGQEVIYMRRIIERRKTSGLFEITRDEHNNEILVPKSLKGDPASKMY